MSEQFVAAEIELLDLYWRFPEKTQNEESPFITKEAEAIFKAIGELYNSGASLTIRTILREAKENYPKVSVETLKDVKATEADENDFEYLKKRIVQTQIKDHIASEVLDELYSTVTKRGELDTDKVMKSVEAIQDSIHRYGAGRKGLYTGAEMIDTLSAELKERNEGRAFYRTGDRWLDESLTYGFAPGSQTTLFSASGLGKTAVKLNIINRRINLRLPTLSIELEMEDVALAERLVGIRKSIPTSMFHPNRHTDEIPPNVIQAVKDQRDSIAKSKMFEYYNEASLSIADLRDLVRDAKKRMGVDYLTVFIDLTTMMKDFSEGSRSTADLYQTAVDRLHELTRAENIHIFNVVQANRDMVAQKLKKPEDVYGITPQPRHVKNSAAFEERSRALIGLNRPKYFLEQMFPDSPENEIEENIMELWFLKQNGGPLGKLSYLYEPTTFRLTKYVEEDE